VVDLMKRLSGKENETYRQWIEHNSSDAYWGKTDYLDRLGELKIPVFLQGGWFDTATNGVKLAYQRLQATGNKNIKMIVGPGPTRQNHPPGWGHGFRSSSGNRSVSALQPVV